MEKPKTTLRDYLHCLNVLEQDVDMSVDGTDTYLAVCGGEIKLSPKAEQYFKQALDETYVDGSCICSEKDEDYDNLENETGALWNANELIKSLAGWCCCTDFDQWFESDDAKYI